MAEKNTMCILITNNTSVRDSYGHTLQYSRILRLEEAWAREARLQGE